MAANFQDGHIRRVLVTLVTVARLSNRDLGNRL